MSGVSGSRVRRGLAVVLIATAAAAIAADASAADAAAYPEHPIRFVVPYPPGGGNDAFARIVGQKLAESVGQAVFVDNKAGAAGMIAGNFVAKAPPDGYTIMVDQSSIATNQLLFEKPPFDLKRELAPVMLGATLDNAMLVSPGSPFRSVRDLVAAAKANPGKVAYASPGIGSSQHLAMELFCAQAGIRMLHVPYKGTSAAILAVSTNDVQVFLISAATAQNYIRSGQVRAIATTGDKRSPAMPDVPTMIESGFPGYTNYNWLGVFAPAGTPPAIVAKLNAELVKAVRDPGVVDLLGKQGWTLVGGSPAALARTVDDEMARYTKVIRDGGIRIEQP